MSGSLDCIIGSMKSGKSSELLRRLTIDSEIGYKVLYINSSKDTRCLDGVPYSTHNPLFINGLKSENIDSIAVFNLSVGINVENYDVIGIDEAQFFEDLVESVLIWVEKYHKKVVVAGLTATYERKKFGKILDLEPYSDTFVKLSGLCEKCAPKERNHSVFTHKIVKNGLIEDIGGKDKYMSLCRKCYLELNS
jgi:thymidine kinase